MDNPEYIFQILEVFSKIKTKEIPRELEEYISYVARTGDPVFQWSLVKELIKEKLIVVLNEFTGCNQSVDIPPCPNVDVFNFDTMKNNLLVRLDSFVFPPFTIQRLCELLSNPRKEYNRIDKYMRAIEKNVLVVSACELSIKRRLESEGNDALLNGILYDKVSVSLNNFSSHVFSEAEEPDVNSLDVNSKLDVSDSDDVQQIINESWSDQNNDKVNVSMNAFTNHVFSETEEQDINSLNISNKIDVTEGEKIIVESWSEENSGKVDVSFNNFTDHVFSETQENEENMNENNKFETSETDSVQQIINDSWTEQSVNDKVNLTLNSYTDNDTFPETGDCNISNLDVSSDLELSQTNDIQQIMSESWNETNNDKVNVSVNNFTTSVFSETQINNENNLNDNKFNVSEAENVQESMDDSWLKQKDDKNINISDDNLTNVVFSETKEDIVSNFETSNKLNTSETD